MQPQTWQWLQASNEPALDGIAPLQFHCWGGVTATEQQSACRRPDGKQLEHAPQCNTTVWVTLAHMQCMELQALSAGMCAIRIITIMLTYAVFGIVCTP